MTPELSGLPAVSVALAAPTRLTETLSHPDFLPKKSRMVLPLSFFRGDSAMLERSTFHVVCTRSNLQI